MSGTYLSKIPVLVVALVIGIVLVTSAVVPLASDYSDAKTFTNDGYIYMDPIGEDADITLTWTYTDPTKLTINDTVKPLPDGSAFPFTVAFSDDWMARLTPSNNGGIALNIVDTTSSNTVLSASVGTSTSMVIQLSSDTATFTVGTTTITKSIDGGLCISEDWDNATYVLKKSTDTAIVKADSTIYGVGRTDRAVGSADMAIAFTGTIENGATVKYSPNTFTASNVEIVSTELNGYEDAYTLTGFTADFSTDGQTGSVTYNQIFVPVKVVADPDNPAAYKNLVKVVPLMAFIMLVVAAAGMVYLKNKD